MEGWHLALLTVLWALPFPTTITVALRLAAWYFRPGKPITERSYTRRSYERISTVLIVLALVNLARPLTKSQVPADKSRSFRSSIRHFASNPRVMASGK